VKHLLVAAYLSLLALPAAAQIAPNPIQDQVVLNLAVEDWVPTQTARVVLNAEAAIQGADAGKTRDELLAAAKKAAAGEWRIVRFDRSTDQAGLERWSASLETRLAESALGGLADRAKQSSRPGMQLTVGQIDFTPTLAESEAARAKLREQLYKRATEELQRLNAVAGDRKFRVARIDFGTVQMQRPMAMARATMDKAMPAPNFAPANGAEMELSQKATMQANVTFSANAPKD
jgi:predicted secreted protein